MLIMKGKRNRSEAKFEKSIVVKLQVEGLHAWPDCNIEEVGFLKNIHRHIFHITCKKEVSHNNRDIEIIRLKREIKTKLLFQFGHPDRVCNFKNMSCEDIAELLIKDFKLNYCEVLEDNENGAEIKKI